MAADSNASSPHRSRRRALVLGVLAAASLACAPGAATARCTLRQVAALPVTMVGKSPMVHGRINGQDAAFIVDTGAFTSVLSPAAVKRYGLASWSDARLNLRGIAGRAAARRTFVNHVEAGDAEFDSVDFLVAGGAGPDVAGVLGQNVLGRFDAEFDFANGVMRLIRPEGCGSSDMLAYWADEGASTVPMIRSDPPLGPLPPVGARYSFARGGPGGSGAGEISAYGALNGARVRVMFDTGAAVSDVTLGAAARAGVTRTSQGVMRAPRSVGFGQQSARNWLAPFRSFILGGEEVRNTRLHIGEVSLGENEMVLGADFFLAHRVYVSHLQHRIYFTYNGGPVFRLNDPQGAPAAAAPPGPSKDLNTPTNAAGFARRGAAFLSRGQLALAAADFSRVIALEPKAAEPYFDRATVRTLEHQPELALADFDQGLKLKPGDVSGLTARAALRLDLGDRAGAKADLDAAARLSASDPFLSLQVASLYEQGDFFDEAIARYDAWLRAHPKDEQAATAFGGRCRARALARRDLDGALQDCAAALRQRPEDGDLLASRALAHLGRGEDALAQADADAALKLDAPTAWALYGRGLAQLRQGRQAEGEADVQAALAAEPKVVDRARRLGFTS